MSARSMRARKTFAGPRGRMRRAVICEGQGGSWFVEGAFLWFAIQIAQQFSGLAGALIDHACHRATCSVKASESVTEVSESLALRPRLSE